MKENEIKTDYAFYNGTFIHISSIYDVIDGKQINKEAELKALKDKAHNKELFCPCGCKSNVTVVAGPKMARQQHFRLLPSENNKNCIGAKEGINSINSRIVIETWLKDKLKTEDIQKRVPICSISDTERQYEFSFLSENNKIAVNYCNMQSNISEEKLTILDENSLGKCIIHIVDIKNGGCEGQFPEYLKRIQNKQNYCLLLSIEGAEYSKAKLKAVFYDRNYKGLWEETTFADALLSDFEINKYGLIFNHISLTDLLNSAKSKFLSTQEIQKKKVEAAAKAAAERVKKQEEILKTKYTSKENSNKDPSEFLRSFNKKFYKDIGLSKINKPEEDFSNTFVFDESDRYYKWRNFNLSDLLNQQDEQVIDPDGKRWFKCKYCGMPKKESDFITYGGDDGMNTGVCRSCWKKKNHSSRSNNASMQKRYDSKRCSNPNCNGTWQLRINGKTGQKFWGCTNFRNGCRETKPYIESV